jgi:transposase
MEQRVWVGIDWGDYEHAVWMVDGLGNPLADFAVPHSAEGLDQLADELARHGPVTGVAIEATHSLVIVKLLEAVHTVYPINPKMASQWAKCLAVDPAKDDRRAAATLANGLRLFAPQLRPLRPDDPLTRELTLLAHDEMTLITQRTALANTLKDRVKKAHPDVLAWFPDVTKTTACDFVLAFPTPQALREAAARDVQKFLAAHHIGLSPRWQARIAARGQGPQWPCDEATARAASRFALALARQIRTLNESLQGYRRTVDDLFAQHPDAALFASLPGAGAKNAPRLLATFGSDRERFQDAADLQALNGVVPLTKRSGKKTEVLFRWACRKEGRNTMFLFAFASISRSVWARAFYERQRANGHSHALALRNLGAKWTKIIFRMWQTRTPYDERRYLQSLKDHGSPLIDHIQNSEKCGKLMKKLLT